LQPLADDASALLAICGPVLREGVAHDVIALDAEGDIRRDPTGGGSVGWNELERTDDDGGN
jgi:hypothetical protein